jgi:hypothetical protein
MRIETCLLVHPVGQGMMVCLTAFAQGGGAHEDGR